MYIKFYTRRHYSESLLLYLVTKKKTLHKKKGTFIEQNISLGNKKEAQ